MLKQKEGIKTGCPLKISINLDVTFTITIKIVAFIFVKKKGQ